MQDDDREVNADVGTTDGDPAKSPAGQRRRFLTAGAAAVAAAVAGVVVGERPAAAANGDAIKIGQTNTGTVATALTGAPMWFFSSSDSSPTVNAIHNTSGVGLRAASETGTAVTAEGGMFGVTTHATEPGGRGVSSIAFATDGTAVVASAFGPSNSTGIATHSSNGVGVKITAPKGPALRFETGPSMPPTTGVWSLGDIVMNSGLWFCTKAGTGTASRWVKMSSALVPLAAPTRIYDSRPGQDPAGVTKGKIANGQERVIDATLGGAVPTGISAVLVNLTVTETNGAGYLAMFKNGIAWPGTSSINWAQPGTAVANEATTAVDSTSKFKVRCAGETHFVIDVVGFYA